MSPVSRLWVAGTRKLYGNQALELGSKYSGLVGTKFRFISFLNTLGGLPFNIAGLQGAPFKKMYIYMYTLKYRYKLYF